MNPSITAPLLVLALCRAVAAAGPNCQDANGDPAEAVHLRPECDTESLIPAESGCFDRSVDVFGITVWATPDLPQWALDHSVAVFSQYLDSDEDGVADYPNLVAYLTQWNGASATVGHHRDYAVIQCRGDIGSGQLKDILFGVTRTGGQTSLDSDDEYRKVATEEFHHTLHRGLAGLHPNTFGTGNANSELLLSFAQAIDDCQVANECCTDAACGCLPTYNCECNEAGGICTANEHSCSFVQGACSGVYHYPDVGCDRSCAGGGEFFYIGWMTYYGFNEASGPLGGDCLAVSPQEWEICKSADLVANPKTQRIYELVAGKSASKAKEGYVLPTTLPDGVYTATRQPVTGVTWTPSGGGGGSGRVCSGLCGVLTEPSFWSGNDDSGSGNGDSSAASTTTVAAPILAAAAMATCACAYW